MAYRRGRPYSGSDQRGSGLSNQAMRPIVKRFRESKDQTVSILSSRRRGWRAGEGLLLAPDQESMIRRLIWLTTPRKDTDMQI